MSEWRMRCGAGLVALIVAFTAGLLPAAAGAAPFVRLLSPQPEEVVTGPDVLVHFEAGGFVIQPGTCSLHFMLDNEPFQIKWNPSEPQVFRDVPPGTHTIRVWGATPMHEAMPGVFDLVTFHVVYANDENRPVMGEPLLTYNLPQGEYKGIDSGDILLNFLVTGVDLSPSGYRVQYFVDGRRFIVDDCRTRSIKGLKEGLHRIRMELVDPRGRLVPGPFNSVERIIQVSPQKPLDRLEPGQPAPEQPVVDSIHGPMTAGRPWMTPPPEESPEPRVRERSQPRVEEFRVRPASRGVEPKAEIPEPAADEEPEAKQPAVAAEPSPTPAPTPAPTPTPEPTPEPTPTPTPTPVPTPTPAPTPEPAPVPADEATTTADEATTAADEATSPALTGRRSFREDLLAGRAPTLTTAPVMVTMRMDAPTTGIAATTLSLPGLPGMPVRFPSNLQTTMPVMTFPGIALPQAGESAPAQRPSSVVVIEDAGETTEQPIAVEAP